MPFDDAAGAGPWAALRTLLAAILSRLGGAESRLAAMEQRPGPEPLKGEPGPGIADITQDGDDLVITFTDARPARRFHARGRPGADAVPVAPPRDGTDGAGIADIVQDGDDMVITFTDARPARRIHARGLPGTDGTNADQLAAATIEDGRLLLHTAAGRRLDAGLVPVVHGTDGRGLKALVIDQDGILIATDSDGAVERVGKVRGEPGTPGEIMLDGTIDDDGNLVVRLSSGRVLNFGRARGKDGEGRPGRSIASARIDDRDHLVLTFTDGTVEDAGLAAKEGKPGGEGADGADAVPPTFAIVAGALVATWPDGRSETLGHVAGEPGEPGKPGRRGLPGRNAEAAAPAVEIGDLTDRILTAADIGRLREQEIIVNGEPFRILTLG